MTTDREPGAGQDDGAAWLDGLAGRSSTGDAAAEGARLRAALLPNASVDPRAAPPEWREVISRARAPTPVGAASAGSMDAAKPAANDARWRRALPALAATMAVVLVGAGLWRAEALRDAPESVLRGAASVEGAVWRTRDPRQDAKALAETLRAAGAQVTVTPLVEGAALDISCPTAACSDVDARLQTIDLSLDGAGRLTLRVLPLMASAPP